MSRFSRFLLLVAITLPLLACDEPPPTAPNQVIVTQQQIVNLGQPLPNATPSPGPVSVDKTIVSIKITEIGGDGQKLFAVDERFSLTMTPLNSAGKDPCAGFPDLEACGAYTELDPQWYLGAGGTADCASATAIVCDLGPGETNYNRNFRTLRRGSFTVNGTFRSVPPASFTGLVQ